MIVSEASKSVKSNERRRSVHSRWVPRDPSIEFRRLSFSNAAHDVFPFQGPVKTEWFAYGRAALLKGLQYLGLKTGDSVLVPSLICNVVAAPFYALGIRIHYYPVRRNLTPEWNYITSLSDKAVKALFVVNYFGFPNDWETAKCVVKERNLSLIEDNAHGFLSHDGEKVLGSYGDVSFFSLRKTLPVLNGAILAVNRNPAMGSSEFIPRARTFDSVRYVSKVAISGLIRACFSPLRSYLATKSWVPAEGDLRQEFEIGNYMYAASHLSKSMARHYDLNAVARERREVYSQWLACHEEYFGKDAEAIFPFLPDGTVPYVFPVFTSNPSYLIQKLVRSGVEAFMWPFLPRACRENLFRESIVCIPIVPFYDVREKTVAV